MRQAEAKSKGPDTTLNSPALRLLNIGIVAGMLGCSRRHVRRLAEEGKMPRPVRLGNLVRWPKDQLDRWIEEGCEPVRE